MESVAQFEALLYTELEKSLDFFQSIINNILNFQGVTKDTFFNHLRQEESKFWGEYPGVREVMAKWQYSLQLNGDITGKTWNKIIDRIEMDPWIVRLTKESQQLPLRKNRFTEIIVKAIKDSIYMYSGSRLTQFVDQQVQNNQRRNPYDDLMSNASGTSYQSVTFQPRLQQQQDHLQAPSSNNSLPTIRESPQVVDTGDGGLQITLNNYDSENSGKKKEKKEKKNKYRNHMANYDSDSD